MMKCQWYVIAEQPALGTVMTAAWDDAQQRERARLRKLYLLLELLSLGRGQLVLHRHRAACRRG
jgi:hypothetical protein